jgi:hypothetical protein
MNWAGIITEFELQGLFVAAVMPILLCWHMPERSESKFGKHDGRTS